MSFSTQQVYLMASRFTAQTSKAIPRRVAVGSLNNTTSSIKTMNDTSQRVSSKSLNLATVGTKTVDVVSQQATLPKSQNLATVSRKTIGSVPRQADQDESLNKATVSNTPFEATTRSLSSNATLSSIWPSHGFSIFRKPQMSVRLAQDLHAATAESTDTFMRGLQQATFPEEPSPFAHEATATSSTLTSENTASTGFSTKLRNTRFIRRNIAPEVTTTSTTLSSENTASTGFSILRTATRFIRCNIAPEVTVTGNSTASTTLSSENTASTGFSRTATRSSRFAPRNIAPTREPCAAIVQENNAPTETTRTRSTFATRSSRFTKPSTAATPSSFGEGAALAMMRRGSDSFESSAANQQYFAGLPVAGGDQGQLCREAIAMEVDDTNATSPNWHDGTTISLNTALKTHSNWFHTYWKWPMFDSCSDTWTSGLTLPESRASLMFKDILPATSHHAPIKTASTLSFIGTEPTASSIIPRAPLPPLPLTLPRKPVVPQRHSKEVIQSLNHQRQELNTLLYTKFRDQAYALRPGKWTPWRPGPKTVTLVERSARHAVFESIDETIVARRMLEHEYNAIMCDNKILDLLHSLPTTRSCEGYYTELLPRLPECPTLPWEKTKAAKAESDRLKHHMGNGSKEAFALHKAHQAKWYKEKATCWYNHAHVRAENIHRQRELRRTWLAAHWMTELQTDETDDDMSEVSDAAFEIPAEVDDSRHTDWNTIRKVATRLHVTFAAPRYAAQGVMGKLRGWATKGWDTLSQCFG